MNPDQLKYKIGIGLIPKIGPVLTRRLVAYCGSVEGVFVEKRANLSKIPGIGEILAESIFKNRNFELVDKELEFIDKNRITSLFYLDEDYPERLKQCEDAPVMLYIKGKANLNRKKIIAVVGTRTPTEYGRNVTKDFVEKIAVSHPDMLVVSGLAYGIDICAHKAALKHNLETAAILGHGLSIVYPAAHREVAAQISSQGALITEFMHDEKPESSNFVKRNRIIAGLADAVIVVESGEEGGALITADIANSYNRDVFAFPGRATDKYSSGCNRFIKTNRAALVESLKDVEYIMGWKKSETSNEPRQKELFVELNDEEAGIFNYIRNNEGITIDQVAINCSVPVSKASAILLNLEFKGLVKCLPGKVFKLSSH